MITNQHKETINIIQKNRLKKKDKNNKLAKKEKNLTSNRTIAKVITK